MRGEDLMVELLKLFPHANTSVDIECKVGVEVWEIAQLRVYLVKDASMKIALHIVFAKLINIVDTK